MPEDQSQPPESPTEGGGEKEDPTRQEDRPSSAGNRPAGKDKTDFRPIRQRRHGLLARFDLFDDYLDDANE